jgi:cold shock CspA family protein
MSNSGTFKSFNVSKGWGFITSEGKDVFFHRCEVKGRPPKEGDTLTFDMGESPTKPGQMVAVNVQGGTTGGHQEGTVKSFSGNHGYGFIEHGGVNVFVHRSEIQDDKSLKPGDQVFFDTDVSPKNPEQTVAKNVIGGTGAPLSTMVDEKGKGKDGKGWGKGWDMGWGKDGGKGWGKDPWGGKGGKMGSMWSMMGGGWDYWDPWGGSSWGPYGGKGKGKGDKGGKGW